MKNRIGKRTAIAALALVIALEVCLIFASTAFAISSSFTWLEGTSPTMYQDIGDFNPSGGIKFAGVATSAGNTTFTVKLQRKVAWWYVDVGNTYTVDADSVSRYDSRLGHYVNGRPFLLVWPTTDNASYRLEFVVQSNPQVVGFTYVSVYQW